MPSLTMPLIDRVAQTIGHKIEQGGHRIEQRLTEKGRLHTKAQTEFASERFERNTQANAAAAKHQKNAQLYQEAEQHHQSISGNHPSKEQAGQEAERFFQAALESRLKSQEAKIEEQTINNLRLKPFPRVPFRQYNDRIEVQAQSLPLNGKNGKEVTMTFPPRGKTSMAEYTRNVLPTAYDFAHTLRNYSSPYVRPELAAHYGKWEHPSAAPQRLRDTVEAFENEGDRGNLKNLLTPKKYNERPVVPNQPEKARVGVEVLGHRARPFEIRAEMEELELHKTLLPTAAKTSEQHVADGVALANRAKDALDRVRTEGLDGILSVKMLRNNVFSKKLTTRGLADLEQTTDILTDETIQKRIRELPNHIQFKVTRDGISRITRLNEQGRIIHRTEFNGIPRSGRISERSIQEGILQALEHGEEIAQQDAPQLSKRQEFRNSWYSFKHKIRKGMDNLAAPPLPARPVTPPPPKLPASPPVLPPRHTMNTPPASTSSSVPKTWKPVPKRSQSPAPKGDQGVNPQELTEKLEEVQRSEESSKLLKRLERLQQTEPSKPAEQIVYVSTPIKSHRELTERLKAATNIIGTSEKRIRFAPEMAETGSAKPVFLQRGVPISSSSSQSISPISPLSGNSSPEGARFLTPPSSPPPVPPKYPLDSAPSRGFSRSSSFRPGSPVSSRVETAPPWQQWLRLPTQQEGNVNG
jgi:hypothetical protein